MTLALDIRVTRASLQIRAVLQASEGETVALLGPNGAGKSTVVDCLAGLLEPDDGRITLDDDTWVDVAGNRWTPAERPTGGRRVPERPAVPAPHRNGERRVPVAGARGRTAVPHASDAASLLTRLGFPAARRDARPNESVGR